MSKLSKAEAAAEDFRRMLQEPARYISAMGLAAYLCRLRALKQTCRG